MKIEHLLKRIATGDGDAFEQKYNEYVAEVTEYQKPDNFDDDYEDWLEECYEDYRENWDDKKNNWHPHS